MYIGNPTRARALLAAAALLSSGVASAGGSDCEKTAKRMFVSCRAEVYEEYQATLANCLNVTEGEEEACVEEARTTRVEDASACGDVRDAREDACELLGEERYDVEPLSDPSRQFVHPDTVGGANAPNPFVSLVAGHTHVLRAGEGFEETVVVHVTDETREILGQPCRVVVDVVVEVAQDQGVFEYEPVEVTDDWLAQTVAGDVVYCGELARNYEDGVLRDLDGSFEAGVDFAKSGVLIEAAPAVGDAHRQEFFLGEAEDLIEYVDLAASVPAEEGGDNPLFPCAGGCLKTAESVPPEPDGGEFKYYVPGLGFVLGIALEDGEPTGERDELVCTGDSLDVLQDPACQIGDPAALLDALCALAPDTFCVE